MSEKRTHPRDYPADALGIRVELVHGPIYDTDGATCGSRFLSDTHVQIDRRPPVEYRRLCAAEARRHILEMNLPEEEMATLATDLAEVEQRLAAAEGRAA